ncbi:MAG: acyl-CoA dehydrogenase family protein [Candidatus Binatia bacterium]
MYLDLNLQLTEEQSAFRESVHRFALEVLRPRAAELDRRTDPADVITRGSPLWDVLRQAYQLGYHKVMLPAEVGGLGFGGLEQHMFLEELGWGSADFAIAIGVAGFPFATVAKAGSPELIDEIVRPFVEDTTARFLGCWAITEPDHGSDTLIAGTPEFHDPRIKGDLFARRDGDDYVLCGQKSAWVSNGTIATHALTFLSLDPSQGMAGGGVAVIPLDLRGVTRGKPLDKMGQRALNQGEIFFDDVRLPARFMLTGAELYELTLDMTLALANAAMGAVFTGVARAAYEAALVYTTERVQGGKRLCEHQLVQKRLVDMFTRVEACRQLSRAAMVYNHATLPPATQYSIASKTFCTEAALEVASSALQLFGGNGLSREYPIEKIFRDARASLIEDGSNDVLALVAARHLLANVPAEGTGLRGAA